MKDCLVEEVRRIREALAARCNYDLDRLFRELKDRERSGGLQFVDGVARLPIRASPAQRSETPGLLACDAALQAESTTEPKH